VAAVAYLVASLLPESGLRRLRARQRQDKHTYFTRPAEPISRIQSLRRVTTCLGRRETWRLCETSSFQHLSQLCNSTTHYTEQVECGKRPVWPLELTSTGMDNTQARGMWEAIMEVDGSAAAAEAACCWRSQRLARWRGRHDRPEIQGPAGRCANSVA